MAISSEKFVEMANNIHSKYKVTYSWGSSGQLSGGTYLCDCRGYIIWSLRLAGITLSCPGTNYMTRNQMSSIKKFSSISELTPGQVVFKAYEKSNSKWNLPIQYRKGQSQYSSKMDELDIYHVGIVIQTTPTLIIRHCSSGGIRTDTSIGNWSWCGWLKNVSETSIKETNTRIGIVLGPGRLNLRANPTTSANRICYLDPDVKVEIIKDIDNNWYQVKYKTYIGYVMKKYLKEKGDK